MTTPDINTVRGIILNENSEILVGQRSDHCKTNGGLWEFPGGKIESSDQVADVWREVYEETAIQSVLEPGDPFYVHDRPFRDGTGPEKLHRTTFRLGFAATSYVIPQKGEVACALWLPCAAIGGLALTVASGAALGVFTTVRPKKPGRAD